MAVAIKSKALERRAMENEERLARFSVKTMEEEEAEKLPAQERMANPPREETTETAGAEEPKEEAREECMEWEDKGRVENL